MKLGMLLTSIACQIYLLHVLSGLHEGKALITIMCWIGAVLFGMWLNDNYSAKKFSNKNSCQNSNN